jgi:hypothetical protein
MPPFFDPKALFAVAVQGLRNPVIASLEDVRSLAPRLGRIVLTIVEIRALPQAEPYRQYSHEKQEYQATPGARQYRPHRRFFLCDIDTTA